MKLHIVVLAAGKGTRMKSRTPKVLHCLSDRPLLAHVLDRAQVMGAHSVDVVYGHGSEQVLNHFSDTPANWVLQEPQLGTGHALMQAMPHIDDDATVLVLYGDVPLIQASTLQALVEAAAPGHLALLTARLPEPGGYGRIIRDGQGQVIRIVEKKDASAEELAVNEINTGFLAAPAGLLRDWLSRLQNNNAQGEYYLTDVVAMAVAQDITISDQQPAAMWEIMGVNSQGDLAELERIHQENQAQILMDQGVTIRDPNRFDLRGELHVGQDVNIDVNVVLEGKVVLGDNVRIRPNVVIRDAEIGANSLIKENCVIEQVTVGAGCIVGPFARLRPGTTLDKGVHIGNFVELKNSRVGEGSKINHLSYVGDTRVGKGVNIGAGTITCNYDGVNKHRTVIGDHVFIGSDTQLVAPVTIGDNATIGAGSTITNDAPAGELTLSRNKQKTVTGWKRPVKKNKA
jgi:bifunctional UDP-N-acetylglucosamine pyrophosphorylase/glucosamine-1-phosphate N-acetyltransferase